MPLLPIFKELIFKIINLMNMKKIVKWAFLLGIAFSPLYGMAEDKDVVNEDVMLETTDASDDLPACIEIRGLTSSLPVNMMGYYTAVFDGGIPSTAQVEWIVRPGEKVYFNPENGYGNPMGIRFAEEGEYLVVARLRDSVTGASGRESYIYVTIE